METLNLKEMISNGKKVHFTHYRDGELWYKTDNGFAFPVSVLDEGTGSTIFLSEDRAMLFMRYIRKHIETIETSVIIP